MNTAVGIDRRTIGRVALVGGLAFGLFGSTLATVGAQDAEALVRISHNAPDAPAVDVFVNGERALEGLAFGDNTDFVPLPTDGVDIQVVPAGGEQADAVIDVQDLALEPGSLSEVAAVGFLADIAPGVYPIDVSPIAEGNARVGVIHNSPDAPAVDIAVTGGDVLVPGLAFPDSSGYIEVPAGTYDLEVRPAGATDVALALPGVVLDANTVYSVFAIGTLADGTLQAKVLTTTPTGAEAGAPADDAAAAGGADDAAAPEGIGGGGRTGGGEAGTDAAVGGATAPTAMPAAGVGSLAGGGLAAFGLLGGALAAAGAAFVGLRRRAG
jgi:hypothetical protein